MDKFNLFLKGILASIGAVWSLAVGTLGWAFPTLVIMMAADFISGIWAGSTNGGLSSSVGRIGFIKKLYILILIGTVYLLEKSIFDTQFLGDGVTVAYVVLEFLSLVENGGKLGVPLGPIQNIIAVLKEKNQSKNDSK